MKKEAEAERFLRYKKEIIKIIHSVLPGCKIYLFGSRARKNHSLGSDIDIAIDANKPIKLKKIYLIQDKIEKTNIPQNVDIVDLYSASDVFKQEVANDGVPWEN